MRNFLTLSLALLLAVPVFGQRSKKSTESMPVQLSEGITYSLPRTAIRVKVTATRTDFIPGPYALYAETLLGIQNVKNQARMVWSIDGIEFSTFGVADPEQRFRTGSLSTPILQLTADGCLAGFNTTATSAVTQEAPVTNFYAPPASPVMPAFTRLTNSNDLTGRAPVEQRAAAAAATIMKARTARMDIVTGMFDEFHPDGDAYEESLNELRKVEKTNLELFTGKSSSSLHTFVYDFTPSSTGARGEVIFRFDEALGFLPKSDFSGKPVLIDVELTAAANGAAAGTAATSGGPATLDAPATGLFYRQPAWADVRLSQELTIIATTRLPLAQMGSVIPVPAELLNGTTTIEFHPVTGAITTVTRKQ